MKSIVSKMIGFFSKRVPRLGSKESGFTLVELLVVVGIIVALAAVIIPSVASFAGKGDEGAQAAEWENVQAAMDLLLADEGITSVTANDLVAVGTASQTWSALPVNPGTSGYFLDQYLRSDTTKYFYCWDLTALVTEQFESATLCTV